MSSSSFLELSSYSLETSIIQILLARQHSTNHIAGISYIRIIEVVLTNVQREMFKPGIWAR